VIRFSASLVVVGIGLLVAGSVTSRLPLIYIAIGVSAVALLFLIIGAIVNRAELLGREPESAVGGQTERGQTEHDEYAGELDQAPEPATTAVGAGASVGSGRGYAGERAADPGYGAAPTPPDRPRETSFPDQLAYLDNGDAEPTRGAGRYERFAGDAERGRPNEPQPRPQRPFTEPEPTRMDLSAAAVREAGRQQERERSERGQQERSQPQRSRPEQAQPFVDPQPTRMDWAGGLREAERQELARQDQERRARERPERDKRGGDRTDQPFVDPEPTRMDWAADFREHDQRGGTAAPGRPSGERETAHTGQVAPTRPTPIQQPAPTQPTPSRPDKLLVGRPDSARQDSARQDSARQDSGRPDSKSPAGPEQHGEPEPRRDPEQRREPEPRPQPEQAREPAKPAAAAGAQPPSDLRAKPEADRSGDNDAGDTERPAEQATEGQSDTDRSAQASATRAEEALAPATDDPPADQATATDDQDSSGSEPAAAAAAEPDQDVTVVPGVPRFHRSDCILIRFMGEGDLQRMPVERAKEAGCTPCRACQPEGEEDD
jgi:hypothetical protein